MPLLLVVLSVQPHFLWWSSGLKVIEMEGLWRFLTMSWNFSGREMLKTNTLAMMAVGDNFADIDRLMSMSIEDVWQTFILPPLHIFSLLPLSMLVPPVAVTVFRRDIDNGAYKAYRLNGGRLRTYLSSKFLVQGLMLAPMQLLSMVLALVFYADGTGRPIYFEISDPIWWWCWMGIGLGLGLWTIVISWLMCLVTHNGCTEIYTSLIAGCCAGLLCLGSVRLWGWNSECMLNLSLFIWLSIPVLLVLLGLRMRSASYLFR
jgi:hypothetical protein